MLLLANCQQGENKGFFLGSGIGVNNLTLLANNIDSTTKYYNETLGFRVGQISENREYEGLLSSSINFSDMTSFEIFSLSDSSSQESIPAFIIDYLADHEGIRLYALSTSSADSTSLWLKSQGFEVDSVNSFRTSEVSNNWSRDDGSMNRNSLDFNREAPMAHLPRFVEKTTFDYKKTNEQWRTYYSYNRMYRKHPNGVVGISAVKVAVSDLRSSIETFKNMGFNVIEINDQIARFSLFRNQELQLHSETSDKVVADFISERGEGVFGVRFEVENLDTTTAYLKSSLNEDELNYDQKVVRVPSEYAFGVELEFVQESKEQGEMAAMLSFNQGLAPEARKHASTIYTKYCALCHGDNREGYAADNAPSLKSKSLLATSMNNNFMRYTIQFGRANTAMAGYLDSQGGPLELIDIEILLKWLYEEAGVDEAIDPSRDPVYGDISMGANIYEQKCASCHGDKGEGVTAPALGNPMLLATATDHFLRYAIAEGRDGTPMIAFKDSLSDDELDAVTAFLRSRASGWDVPEPSTVTPPTPDEYVLNPKGLNPEFDLREDKFVSAEQVNQAMKEGRKMILMDARSEVAWRQMHIPGSFPVPYYEDPENFIDDIPDDGTEIVIYCACPHAASLRVMSTLKRYGFENVSIIDEGILVWAQMGFPVMNGK
ncbi:MAG: c-type cytochrome [Balneolaceae bacterium]|nr:c-type cytochrome [Balneolaceae bacterium]MBO6546815.1 c-type cytochrome [Balneolaceae bacterium]MBO6649175.1 c-type cytochrome [Balneolaceae bacterium]